MLQNFRVLILVDFQDERIGLIKGVDGIVQIPLFPKIIGGLAKLQGRVKHFLIRLLQGLLQIWDKVVFRRFRWRLGFVFLVREENIAPLFFVHFRQQSGLFFLRLEGNRSFLACRGL